MGRPLKFGEPTVKREFRLPETLNQQLTAAARARGDDVSDVLRQALEKEVGGDPQPTVADEVRRAVQEAMTAQQGGYELDLNEAQRSKLKTLSGELRLKRPEHLIAGLVRVALQMPVEYVDALLTGGFERVVDARTARKKAGGGSNSDKATRTKNAA